MSLNPCCSGQWPRTVNNNGELALRQVLILIVVDNGLVPYGLVFDEIHREMS